MSLLELLSNASFFILRPLTKDVYLSIRSLQKWTTNEKTLLFLKGRVSSDPYIIFLFSTQGSVGFEGYAVVTSVQLKENSKVIFNLFWLDDICLNFSVLNEKVSKKNENKDPCNHFHHLQQISPKLGKEICLLEINHFVKEVPKPEKTLRKTEETFDDDDYTDFLEFPCMELEVFHREVSETSQPKSEASLRAEIFLRWINYEYFDMSIADFLKEFYPTLSSPYSKMSVCFKKTNQKAGFLMNLPAPELFSQNISSIRL